MSETKTLSREEFKHAVKVVSRRENDQSSAWDKVLDSDQLQRDRITELEGRLSRLDEDVKIAICSTPGAKEALGPLLDAAPFDAPAALNRYAVWARETIATLTGEIRDAVTMLRGIQREMLDDEIIEASETIGAVCEALEKVTGERDEARAQLRVSLADDADDQSELAALRLRLEESRSVIVGQLAWLKFKNEHGPTKHIDPDADSHGPHSGHPHGYCAVLFPDWDVRQKIESLTEDLAAIEAAKEKKDV